MFAVTVESLIYVGYDILKFSEQPW